MNCSFLCFCGKVSSDGGETKQRSVGFDTTISSEHTGIPLWLTKCYCATVVTVPEAQLSVLGMLLTDQILLYTVQTCYCYSVIGTTISSGHTHVTDQLLLCYFTLVTIPESQPSVLSILLTDQILPYYVRTFATSPQISVLGIVMTYQKLQWYCTTIPMCYTATIICSSHFVTLKNLLLRHNPWYILYCHYMSFW